MLVAVYALFGVLALLAVGFQLLAMKTKSQIVSANNPQFKIFQNNFFLVYFMAFFSDWLQGPYVYKLYHHYGYAKSQIAILYVAGFASSGIFGTVTGSVADKFGRKRTAIGFCLLYSFCCLTKVSSEFFWLFLGRIFGGVSTSILFSTFESWYVYEHTQKYDFPSEWISVTFSACTFWNGILAITAGITANVFAESLAFGPLAPFLIAIPFLIVACVIISKTWAENYGNQEMNVRRSCMEGLRTVLFNDEILSLGIVQSLFEANMYIFVFQWTPILDPVKPPLGMVFACFMICIMIGSSLYALLHSKNFSAELIFVISVSLAIVSMLTCSFTTSADSSNIPLTFIAFLILEVSVGMYFPAVGYLRSQLIPEDQRAGIMNWFRLPTNFITCVALLILNQGYGGSNQSMFMVCSGMLFVALFHSIKLKNQRANNGEKVMEATEHI